MMSLQEQLRQAARERLNRLQERVVRGASEGRTLADFAERAAQRLREAERLLEDQMGGLSPAQVSRVGVWYARLELEYGAGEAEIRQAYQALMRRYHPDRFTREPELEQHATRLSQELNEAYRGLLQWRGARPRS